MSISDFPSELLHSICVHLPNYDLVSVAGTNLTLCAVAQRLLYRHISLTVTAANHGAITTLATRPDISRYVRTFSLTAHEQSSDFYHLLATAISGMAEISSFHLFLDPETSWLLNKPGNEGTTYDRLRHFACSFPFDANVVNFLGRAPEVADLEVNATSISPLPNILPTFIPHLAHFQGPSHVAAQLVPGRPVQALYLSSGVADDSVLFQLAKSASKIVLLDAITSSGLLSCLEAIADNMPSLVHLRLMTTYPFDDHPDLPFYEQVSKLLSRLPELTSFEFSGMSWTSWLTHDDRLTDSKRIWQSRPPSPRFPSSNIREDDARFDGFSENFLLF